VPRYLPWKLAPPPERPASSKIRDSRWTVGTCPWQFQWHGLKEHKIREDFTEEVAFARTPRILIEGGS
jgi:hypothetical protein